MDADALSAAVIEQLCVQDAIPLKLLVGGAPGRIMAEALEDGDDLNGTLDRLLNPAGTLALIYCDKEAASVIDVFGAVYDRLVDQHGIDRIDLHVRPDAFRLKLISRAYALGGLLVRPTQVAFSASSGSV